MNRGSLHTGSFRCIHLSIFRYRLSKNGFQGPKVSGSFKKRAPWKLRKLFGPWSKIGDMHTPETSWGREPLFIFSNMWIKQPCNHKVWDFAATFRVRTFEKCWAPGAVNVSRYFVGSLLALRVFLKAGLLTLLNSNSIWTWSKSALSGHCKFIY